MLTVKVTVEPVLAETGDAGETSEYQKFGTPFAVVQLGFPLEFPELVLVNATLGLWFLISVTVKLLVVSCMVNVSVVEFCELTEKLACPF